jgi:MFS family permease
MSTTAVVKGNPARRAIVASVVGTTIEWYDFFLYGTAAALVFPKLFFPGVSPAAGILAAFATQFVGFAARPIGAAIFGHYGDRIGRKAALIATLMLMGVGTVLIGLLPSYAAIGILAPILLVVLRTAQGIGVGVAPSARTVSSQTGAPGVRMRTPARSAGLFTGFMVSRWRAPWYQLNDRI